ncbi:MAG TPA: PAS domain S-box protein, partial [Dehalococcoidia bacterium]
MESPEAIGTFGREPTQRIITELAEAAADPRFRTLADCAPVMVWMSDVDKLVTFINQGWLDFTGRTFEQESGNGWSAGVHPDDFDGCLAIYTGAFDARENFRMEYRLRRADGEYRWILDTGAPLYTAAGEFAGYIGSCIDITERKQMEEDLRKANAAKDEFLALVSHELRTPLATIFGNAEIMATRGEKLDDQTKRAALEDIRAEAARLQQVIENMLSLARAEARVAGPFEPCLVGRVLDRVLVYHAHQHPARTIQVSIEADFPPVAIEATYLEQVFHNLISNAEKYSAPFDLIEILT